MLATLPTTWVVDSRHQLQLRSRDSLNLVAIPHLVPPNNRSPADLVACIHRVQARPNLDGQAGRPPGAEGRRSGAKREEPGEPAPGRAYSR